MLNYYRYFKRWLLALFFKVKPHQPPTFQKEVKTSGSDSLIISEAQAIREGTKKEKEQWFQKKNDLRQVNFDLNPIWENHKGVEFQNTDHLNSPVGAIRAEDQNENYTDKVPNTYNPWEAEHNKSVNAHYHATPTEHHDINTYTDHSVLSQHDNSVYSHSDSTSHDSHDYSQD